MAIVVVSDDLRWSDGKGRTHIDLDKRRAFGNGGCDYAASLSHREPRRLAGRSLRRALEGMMSKVGMIETASFAVLSFLSTMP